MTKSRLPIDEGSRKGLFEERNRSTSNPMTFAGVSHAVPMINNLETQVLSDNSTTVNNNLTAPDARNGFPNTKSSIEDEPFLPPEEPDFRRLSVKQADESYSAKTIDTAAPVKTPSLSRSVASAHRLSRHSRQNSRMVSSNTNGPIAAPASENTNIVSAPQSTESSEQLNTAPVRGISLEDGDVDYD